MVLIIEQGRILDNIRSHARFMSMFVDYYFEIKSLLNSVKSLHSGMLQKLPGHNKKVSVFRAGALCICFLYRLSSARNGTGLKGLRELLHRSRGQQVGAWIKQQAPN